MIRNGTVKISTTVQCFFRSKHITASVIVAIILVIPLAYKAFATTPDPGHPWTQVGDGTFAVTGPTVARTYTLPDLDTTILTSNTAVTVPQGGTGLSSIAQGDILYGSAPNTVSVLSKDTNATRYLSNTGSSNNPAWAQVDLTNGISASLPAANGGTNSTFTAFTGPTTSVKTFTVPTGVSATVLTDNAPVTHLQGGFGVGLTASNGGIFYQDTATTTAILAGTATAGRALLSGATAAPTWSTATYSSTAGTAGKILRSDGTNFVSSTATYPDTGGTSGNLIMSDGTNFSSSAPPDVGEFVPVGLYAQSAVPVTAVGSGVTYFEYIGVAPKAYTTCNVVANVTTGLGNNITWAEVAIFKGTPVINGNASLTRLGYTDVSATFNSTGRKTTAVTLTGAAAGDNLWAAFGSVSNTRFQIRGMLADDIQSGVFQTASIQPSAASSPQATTIAGATVVPGRLSVTCL